MTAISSTGHFAMLHTRTRASPTAEVRVVDGRVQLRRGDEPRTLRTMPVGG